MSSRSLVLLRPTLESGIYLLLIIVSAILRFWGLGERPLSPLEADLAYRAWEFYMGRVAEPNLGLQPLLFQTNLLGYFLLGSSDAVVRLVPAAIGTVLVAAAYFLREAVGRVAALLVALFLAFSPISVFFSRYAGGQVVEALGSVLLISGIFGYLRNKTSHSLYLSAAGGALIILSTGFLNPLFGAILLFPLIYSLGNLFRTGGFSEALDYFREAIPSREVMARAGLIFIGMILLLPTGGFLLPQGLQAAVAGLLSIPTPLSAVPSPILVLAYEPLVFLLGILGGLFLILQDPKALFLLIWLAVGLGLGPATSPLSLALPLT
ncbi:MAG: hypothetical protein HYX86_05760, partial [Chloroflexi bacterium]|nr:hypothetical protein [Chloroflexota bacterium]